MTIEDRFWAKVDRSSGPAACWLWLAGKTDDGYGKFTVANGADGRKVRSHRYSWELANGSVPDGMKVCHNCPGGDNPACVNPAHLFLGTIADNNRDMIAKGRMPRGEARAHAKLNETQVREIKRALRSGVPARRLAREYGVWSHTIDAIKHGKRWCHVQ